MKKGKKRILTILIGSFSLLIVLLLFLHTKPVRNFILRSFVSYLEKKQGLIFSASSLNYNLASMRLKLKNVSVSLPEGGEMPPFFEAEDVAV